MDLVSWREREDVRVHWWGGSGHRKEPKSVEDEFWAHNCAPGLPCYGEWAFHLISWKDNSHKSIPCKKDQTTKFECHEMRDNEQVWIHMYVLWFWGPPENQLIWTYKSVEHRGSQLGSCQEKHSKQGWLWYRFKSLPSPLKSFSKFGHLPHLGTEREKYSQMKNSYKCFLQKGNSYLVFWNFFTSAVS